MSSLTTTTTHSYVQAGACVNKTNELEFICALEAHHCPTGTIFVSSRQLLEEEQIAQQEQEQQQHLLDGPNHDQNLTATTCLSQKQTNAIHVGRCGPPTTDFPQSSCTSHAEACPLPVEFIIMDEHCSIQWDTFDSLSAPTPTLYPLCHMTLSTMSNFVCVWNQRDDCPLATSTTTTEQSESESFESSQELLELMELFGGNTEYNNEYQFDRPLSTDCTCDKVRTGACFHAATKTYTCAVSAQACDNDTEFISWKFVTLSHNDQEPILDCRLCTPPVVPVPQPSSSSPPQSTSFSPVETPVVPPPTLVPTRTMPVSAPVPIPTTSTTTAPLTTIATVPTIGPIVVVSPTALVPTNPVVTTTTTTTTSSGGDGPNVTTAIVLGVFAHVLVGILMWIGLQKCRRRYGNNNNTVYTAKELMEVVEFYTDRPMHSNHNDNTTTTTTTNDNNKNNNNDNAKPISRLDALVQTNTMAVAVMQRSSYDTTTTTTNAATTRATTTTTMPSSSCFAAAVAQTGNLASPSSAASLSFLATTTAAAAAKKEENVVAVVANSLSAGTAQELV